jgi:hypothetical protein
VSDTPAERQRRYYARNPERRIAAVRAGRRQRAVTAEGQAARLVQLARDRSKRMGLANEVTKQALIDRFLAQDNRCCRTGIPFVYNNEPSHPWQPSLDRLDNDGGYTMANLQLVCLMYNLAKNQRTDEEVVHFARAMVDFLR